MGDFNEDELHPPTWMDRDFFEMVLRDYEKDHTIVVRDLKLTPGSGKGDHMASIMFRAVTEYSSGSKGNSKKSMIIKTLPEAECFKKDMLEKMPIFETEIAMYSQEVPKFEQILREQGDDTQLSTKMIYHSLSPRKVIIFEDLVAQGYECVRDRFLTIDEIKASLTKLAKWHAASYKLAEEGDETIKSYHDGMLSKPKEELPAFITKGLQMLSNSVAKIEGLEMYAEKLRALDETLIQKCNNIFKAPGLGRKGIMVLTHGDFHLRNIMFKHDAESKLEDIMLIDFQISAYAPAVVDISYFLYMLLPEEMRKERREELIYFYFSIFTETLKKAKFTGELPTLAELYMDMYRYKEYELWVMAHFLPMIHAFLSNANDGEVADPEKMVSSEDALSLMYQNPGLINELRWLLPKYLYSGYLD